MAYQLIFTSSPVSLTTGRTGFSTVARSKIMPEKLAAAVERCSVYEIHSGTVYSHRIIQSGGQKWHLLSRVKDAGVDYTNRNNFIAHHVVLSQAEVESLRANAAEILLSWGGWLDSWEGEPRFIDSPAGLEQLQNSSTLPAKEWARLFGDAGKAALLVGQSVKIKASVELAPTVLRLYSESLQLNIKAADAWDIAFTTHLNASENPQDFQWKVSDVQDFNDGIDVGAGKSPAAPQTRSAQFARTGEMNNREKYNLSVAGPDLSRRKFNVVETSSEKSSPMGWPLLLSASIAVAAVGVAAVFFFFADNAKPEVAESAVRQPAPLPTMEKISADSFAKNESTLSETRDAVKYEIENCNFKKALAIWDESSHAKNDPSYRKKILSDIGYRADALMDFSSRVFGLTNASQANIDKAITNVFAARRALDIPDVPRTDERMKIWKTLNDKIKK